MDAATPALRGAPVNPETKLKEHIGTVPDFPIPGIQFKDITPLLAEGPSFAFAIHRLAEGISELSFDQLVAIESRGFVIAAPLAVRFGSGLILARKPGKLPGSFDSFPYSCEYAKGFLEVRRDSVRRGQRYLIVDDLLATGGTARATSDYVIAQGGAVAGYCFLIELTSLGGRRQLAGDVISLLRYD